MTEKQRTSQQNKALHKWCEEMAVELQNAGVPLDVFFKNTQADYTKETVKNLWRGFAKAKYDKDSTADLTTAQINEIYDECNRHTAQWGIHLPFPSSEFNNLEDYI